MLTKIKRDECLTVFSKFPLREYDKTIDDEIVTYPNIHSLYWLKLDNTSSRHFANELAKQVTLLYEKLNIDRLVFLGDTKSSWISKRMAERKDYKPLINAVTYLTDNKIGRRFNGAIEIDFKEFKTFIKHFYIMTKCEAAFSYFHFLDKAQNLIGYIHYDGELRIDTLNKKTNDLFIKAIKETKFKDAFRNNSNRI